MDTGFRLFVYGTLTQSGDSHHLLKGAVGVGSRTRTPGRCYHFDDGIPYLTVPDSLVLLVGTKEPLADAKRAAKVDPVVAESDEWVEGELYRIADPDVQVRYLDLFEDFEPGSESTYDRVLIPVQCDGAWTTAWAYIIHKNTPTDA